MEVPEKLTSSKIITWFLHQRQAHRFMWLCQDFWQAQPRPQLSWVELALVLIKLAACPAARTSSEIAGNMQNLLFDIFRPATEELNTLLQIIIDGLTYF